VIKWWLHQKLCSSIGVGVSNGDIHSLNLSFLNNQIIKNKKYILGSTSTLLDKKIWKTTEHYLLLPVIPV
jgi:hypothetical protein